ncbi:glycosyltransferase family A protein [Congregibacter variabilis]|uniref:Glycosyltransferase family A protein n=1 Tax=Congregibacter variabilis TaxID=3081200 RepID=A0ABZ0I6A5_9GAMM|nr:glycosyltransferase family A protein [Congregibacter sp. IMCC43200]
MHPLVSVIVPMFNAASTIARAIESIHAQAYVGQIEIVLIDDGSTDRTLEVIHELGVGDYRVYAQANSGASAARRKGVDMCQGDIVTFLDADDMLKPNHIQLHVDALSSSPGCKFSFGFCEDIELVHGKYPIVGGLIKDSDKASQIIIDTLATLLYDGCFPLSMNIACYKDVALRAMSGREHVLAANDYDFCLRLALQSDGVLVPCKTIEIERFETGITARNGGLQPAFACLAAKEAFLLSQRSDETVKAALSHRIETSWPAGFVHCLWNGYYKMAVLTLFTGIRFAPTKLAFRNVYWTLHYILRGN